MSVILGIDMGEARIGVAQTDINEVLAHPVKTITVNKEIGYLYDLDVLEELIEMVEQNDVSEIVIGLPIGDDGKLYQNSEKIQKFGKTLNKAVFENSGRGVEIHYFDERFSTHLAHRIMHENGLAPSRNKQIVDQVAAVNILEGFLESRKKEK